MVKRLLAPRGYQLLCFFAVVSILLLSCGCTQQPTGSQTTPAAVLQAAPAAGTPAVTVTQPDSSHIIITYPGTLQTEKLVELEISITDSNGRVKTESMGSRLATTPVQYGSSHSITGSFDGKDRVFVAGYFSDGSQKPIIDTVI
jgi:hypothetical protein